MTWLDAMNSTWLDLGPEDLGGVQLTEKSITFKHHQPPNIIVRISFSNISENHITWQADSSTDATSSLLFSNGCLSLDNYLPKRSGVWA